MPLNRRGVLLLIALIMLSLFMLLGISYILIANRRRPCMAIAGGTGAKTEIAAQDTSELNTHRILFGLPDGSDGGGTVGATVRPRVAKYLTNSLLADKYGDWFEQSTLGSIEPIDSSYYKITAAGGFSIGPATTIAAWSAANPGSTPDLGSHVGRILSIDSELEPNAVFRVLARQGNTYIAHLVNPAVVFDHRNLAAGATLSIQGREFSGDSTDDFQLHENYDAPDNRNLFMAWAQSEALLGRDQIAGTADDPTDGHRYVIPSFHRPDKLLAILKTGLDGSFFNSWIDSNAISLLRPAGRMSWDPLIDWQKTHGLAGPPPLPTGTAVEHPNFTGGNARTIGGTTVYFDPLHGPWDVDNDGDGVADSVWIDVGMDAIDIGNARVQPLVAMMILDLDGRINLNAHGTDREFDDSAPLLQPQNWLVSGHRYAGTVSGTTSGTAGPLLASLPHGQGWGPAEVDPRKVFRQAPSGFLSALFNGSASTAAQSTPRGVSLPAIRAEGRHGDSASGANALLPAAGYLEVPDPGVDARGALPRDSHVPEQYGAPGLGDANQVRSHNARLVSMLSPIDPWGRSTVGLDQFGQPLMSALAAQYPRNGLRMRTDDPYDISLGRESPRPGWSYDPDVQSVPSTLQDNLFAAPQFERLLRLFEPAADRLSPRLVSLLGTHAETARTTATIESWDTPAVTIPRERLEPLLALSDQHAAANPSLVSWDLAMGLRMDVNRPFGDGIDNNENGIADEPGEFTAEKAADVFGMNGSPFADQCLTNGRDVDGDGDVDADDQRRARELFARHLYVLARKMVPALPARDAAQWAVNVVDMRDPDSIVTRFPYDANSPGSGTWAPNDPAAVVWGCERPEMLITEGMAWRNVRSSTNAMTGQVEYTDKGTGGLVLEFYHPWLGKTDGLGELGSYVSALPREYRPGSDVFRAFSASGDLDLAAVNANGDPVFECVAVKETTAVSGTLAADPTWPRHSATNGALAGIVIHLAKVPAIALTGSDGTYVSRDGPASDVTTLRPGQFALVSGPTPSGTDGVLVNAIDVTASGTGTIEFRYGSFSDGQAAQVLNLTGGLSETVTGSNGYDTANRKCNMQYPYHDMTSGPIGAMVCVTSTAASTTALRFPVRSGTTSDLSYMAAEKYRVLLRRLANPLEAHDPTLNPYLCIDSLVVQDQAVVASGTGSGLKLKSAERCAAQPADSSVNNIWRHATADDDANVAALAPPLMGSISGINASLGFLPARLKVPSAADDLAEAEQPVFPWLTWLNREFTSVHELLLVPKSSPAMLLRDHSHEWPFGHLFFQLGSGTSQAQLELEQNKIGLLELLRVPSRFADAEARVPPAEAAAISSTLVSLGGRPMFLPPHNYLSHFREPGRVNLNTMSSSTVWSAVNGGRPGAPYEDEVVYGNDGTPTAFQKSEDWLLAASGGGSSPSSGNWQIDNAEEDVDGDKTLDVNHDENNDGRRQLSRSGALKSIAASRRGWPISANGETPDIAGQFDRVLHRKGVADDQLWFTAPFQSGWVAAAATAYAADRSLLLRSWPPTETSSFMRLPNSAGYRRLRRTTGVGLTANTEYVCTIRIRGDVSLAEGGADKLPEMQLAGSYEMLDPYAFQRSFADDVTTYTASISPSSTTNHTLQIAIWSALQLDILSVSLTVRDTGVELLTNGDFADGTTGWQGDATLVTDTNATTGGPVYLVSSALGLRDSKGKSQQGRPYADPRRNPFFRYREMMRLSNLTTPRSNVFAVWMTIGFFVVEPHPTRSGQTALGAEYGLDVGDAVRFKSFLIVDRSIPAGFRPGVPLNTRDTVLLDHFGN